MNPAVCPAVIARSTRSSGSTATRPPRSAASASVSSTWATSGSQNVTRVRTRFSAFIGGRNLGDRQALAAATNPICTAIDVRPPRYVTSPIAQIPGTVVAQVSSTTTWPAGVLATPMASRARCVGILSGEETARLVDDRHFTAETTEHLGQLPPPRGIGWVCHSGRSKTVDPRRKHSQRRENDTAFGPGSRSRPHDRAPPHFRSPRCGSPRHEPIRPLRRTTFPAPPLRSAPSRGCSRCACTRRRGDPR